MTAILRWSGIAAIIIICSAHVGSPDAWYDGPAGPYRVVIHIETPGVVPGVAGINVRVTGEGIERVTAVANKFDATGGAPPPEIAKPVNDRPGWWRTTLWIMSAGSNSITVRVHGGLGEGSAVVPIVAVPSRRLEFDRRLGIVLGALGVVLIAGLLTIIGAAVGEGVLPPGAEPDRRRIRLAWMARGGAALAIALLLLGGWKWWGAEDNAFVRSMFKPLASDAEIADHEDGRSLVVTIRDSSWIMRNDAMWLRARGATRRSPLIADHGKLMHLFLVAENGGALAHLHPFTTDSVRFLSALPPLPTGRYNIYGDIVHESGLAETLVSSVEIAPSRISHADTTWQGDRDDAWIAREAADDSRQQVLGDGTRMTWLRSDSVLVAGVDASLRFALSTPAGTPLALEPYMGMPAHAVIVRDDGKVFIHLHPQGTISTAAQRSFVMREIGDTVTGRLAQRLAADTGTHGGAHPTNAQVDMATSDTVAFPYAFPEPGGYRIWVQARRQGRVITGVFAATVAAAR